MARWKQKIAPTRLPRDKQQEEKLLQDLVTSAGRSRHFLDEKLVHPRFASPWRALRSLPSRLRWPLWSNAERCQYFRNLGVMLEAGLPQQRALRLLALPTRPRLQERLLKVCQAVEEGKPLSRALAATGLLKPYHLAYLITAETVGTMGATLQVMADSDERQASFTRQFWQKLSYPMLLLTVTLLTFVGLAGILRGLIRDCLLELVPDDPGLMRLLALLHPAHLIWLSLLAVASITAAVLFGYEPSWRYWLQDKIYQSPALIRFRVFAVVRFSALLGSLLECGVPYLTSLQVLQRSEAAQSDGCASIMERNLARISQKLTAGSNLRQAMQSIGFFPKDLLELVTVGEECGTLPRLLQGYARVKEQEVLTQVNALATWLELACVLGSGLLGLMVALLAFLPMISIVERL